MTNPMLRPLTQVEEKLLRWILEHGADGSKSYLPQLEGMRAKPSCGCGCPSISLVVSDLPAAIPAKERVVADLSGQTAEGISVGVLLFQDAGKLAELEIYPCDNEDAFGLPTIASLSPFEEGKPIS